MLAGHITHFASLSPFKTVKEFNDSTKKALDLHGDHFTKGEHIALLKLIQFSVKLRGVAYAKISTLVQSTHNDNNGISRSTFERMLQKGKTLGLFTIHGTTRKKGGDSHNVYVFTRSDAPIQQKLTDRKTSENPITQSHSPTKTQREALSFKAINKKEKDLRTHTIDSLDYTYVPFHVPTAFIKAVKPFFNRAKEICTIWDRASMAYRSQKFDQPITDVLPVIIQAFKQTVYRYKQNRIKTSFVPYFYAVVLGALVAEKRKISREENTVWGWLG
ncbi:transcriptional regulator [Halalkalibacter wakoensis JCM 9140]|uniref:Transcriptional regulator n=1 Tax=Halalkalibacter wakoensis JCM 9140 TaxID=1236970 RepID=W4Q8Y9_9BACI|nr:hypothetical protein [Halalkalibacter wakoensis]GAE28521.1 transcriptional regulator [Halalkalibacter wakoensis JCM 9140]